METHLRRNDRFQILTPSGWADFKGINRVVKRGVVTVKAGDKTLSGSLNHPVLGAIGFAPLALAKHVVTRNGLETIDSLVIENDREEVFYDPYAVDGGEYYSSGIVSHNCNEFQGSSGTLISGWKLKELASDVAQPIALIEGLSVYEPAAHGEKYVITVDVAEGKSLDYSSFQVISVTEPPYRQVATYRSNVTTATDLAEIIHRVARTYGSAPILIEYENLGPVVAEHLWNEMEYDNLICTASAGSVGKKVSFVGGPGCDRGIKMSKTVKSIGCSMLKLLIEQNQLLIRDRDTINELSTFSKKDSKGFQAEEGKHDDTVMPLVVFGWLTNQNYFRDMTEMNILNKMRELSEETLEAELTPFGFIDDGTDETDLKEGVVQTVGDVDAWLRL